MTPESIIHSAVTDDVKTRLLSCITKAEKALGYKPQTKFEDGLGEVHWWFVENWDDIEKS